MRLDTAHIVRRLFAEQPETGHVLQATKRMRRTLVLARRGGYWHCSTFLREQKLGEAIADLHEIFIRSDHRRALLWVGKASFELTLEESEELQRFLPIPAVQ